MPEPAPPVIETLDQAYVAPLLTLRPGHGGAPGVFDGGVYRGDGSPSDLGLHAKHGFRNVPVPIDVADGVPCIPGTHLYGGLLQNGHFGHFMLESLGRLWAAPALASDPASIVFIPRGPGHSIPDFVHDTLRLLGLKAEIRLVKELTRFERLLVPTQLLVPGETIESHPVFREFTGVLRLVPRTVETPSGSGLYVSRSKLGRSLAHLLLEDRIEANLARAGYTILHPELQTVADQLSHYNAASRILFAEGSALLLYALVARPDQHVGIIKRRRTSKERLKLLVEAHAGHSVDAIDCIDRMFSRDNGRASNAPLLTVVNFLRLGETLRRKGFIGAAEHWEMPDTATVDAALAAWAASTGFRYRELPTSIGHGTSPGAVAAET